MGNPALAIPRRNDGILKDTKTGVKPYTSHACTRRRKATASAWSLLHAQGRRRAHDSGPAAFGSQAVAAIQKLCPRRCHEQLALASS